MLALVLVLCAVVAVFAYIRAKQAPLMRLSEKIPGPKLIPIIGNALAMGFSTSEFFKSLYQICNDYGDTVRIWIGPKLFVVISHPDDMEIVLSSTKVLDKASDYDFLKPWLGNGLLTSYVSKWRKHRKILTPTFHFKILEQFIDVFRANGEILVECLSQQVGKPTFDINTYITLAALDNICESAMGVQVNAQKNSESEYVNAVRDLSEVILIRAFSLWLRPKVLFDLSPQGRLHNKAINILHGVTKDVISQRKRELFEKRNKSNVNGDATCPNDGATCPNDGVKKRLAFLDLLIEASLIEENQLSDEDIREEVDTFMFEGHDTTSSGISFTLWLLSRHPEIQDRVVNELASLYPDVASPITHQNLLEMKYMERVLKEALRLYPSVPFYGREALEDIAMHDGLILPKGTTISIFAYRTHRNPEIFPDPERFDPDRFLPENVQGRHPFAYIPFSAGSRNCIGQKFAMLEMKCTVAQVLRRYRLLPGEASDLLLAGELILKSKSGIRVRIEQRV